MAAETSQTLDRGLTVLTLLAGSPQGLTVTELASAVGVNRTVVYRLVTTLEKHALVRRGGGGRLHAGLGLLGLARGVHPALRDLAGPVLRSLAEECGATAHLTISDGEEALAVAVVEPTWTDFHVGYRVGARHPLARGAAGRAILVGRSLAADVSGHALVDRPCEWVETVGELQSGAHGLAAPVLGVEGLEASVGIVTLGDIDAAAAGPVVAAAARDVAGRLR